MAFEIVAANLHICQFMLTKLYGVILSHLI